MTTKTRPQAKSPAAPKTGGSRSKKAEPQAAATSAAFNDASTVVPSVSREHIAARAYVIWQQKGCPEGCDAENWQQAEQELSAQSFTR
jgi:hypothetical protein